MPFAHRILYGGPQETNRSSSLQYLRPALHSFGDPSNLYIRMLLKTTIFGSHGIWPVCDLAERVRQSFDVLRKVVAIYLSRKMVEIICRTS